MSTVTFNVGGKEFTISKSCIEKSKVLTTLSENDSEVLFLDYNYDAFSVVLDFLRHGQLFVPPTVSNKSVRLLFEELGIYLPPITLVELDGNINTSTTYSPSDDEEYYFPPQYSPASDSKHTFQQSEKLSSTPQDNTNLVDQLTVTVQQKIADLIISTIRPRITTQALQGAYHTTYILLPTTAKSGTLMSEFPTSKFVETIYLEEEVEKFLAQTEVLSHFESALKHRYIF